MPTSLPPLPPRGQPFPFILPEPLGPLSPPSSSSVQANPRPSTPSNPVLLGTYGLPENKSWGARRANPNQVGGFVMPNPIPASTTGFSNRISRENLTEPRIIPSYHGYPRQFGNQDFAQPAANIWHTPAPETYTPPLREEHDFALERPSAAGTHGDNSEVAQYHKCDQCHEAFTTSSWLKRHKTTHFRRFRCGCGAAYIDRNLLLVSLSSPSKQHILSRLMSWMAGTPEQQGV